MSVLFELEDNMSNLPAIIGRYEAGIADVNDRLSLDGKTLERANQEHASWQSYYDERRIELYSLMKQTEDYVNKVKGELWVNYTERFSIELSTRDKEMYINKEPVYLASKRLYNIVCEMYKKYEAVVDAYRSRGFALRNITNIRCAALEDVVL